MTNQFQLILIFVSVIIGVVSATYFYQSADIFVTLLKKPLRLISSGMFVISIGVLLAAVISYISQFGIVIVVYGIPLAVIFYVLYIIGSIMIFTGARQFASRPKPVSQP